jgi:uncharacterized protein (TIGR03083 family)
MTNDAETWKLIHRERAAMADTLETLTTAQWSTRGLCAGWTVQDTAGHIVGGAEQTTGAFLGGLVKNGFRFNTMMDRVARTNGARPPSEIIARLRARTTTTNKAPAPVMTMLGEIVVHGEDIRHPLGIDGDVSADALAACLTMYTKTGFPVGTKKRIAGLRLAATDIDWSHGDGPEVSGPGLKLLLAMTGRRAGLDALGGDGLSALQSRFGSSAPRAATR